MRTKVHATSGERLADLAAKGLTQAQAARVLGVSRQRVNQLAARLRLTFRPGYPPVPEKRLAELAKKGLSQTQAARELGVSQKRLSKVAAKIGISFPPVWMRPRPATTELGRVLQAARLAAGYSYSALAALSGLHRRHVIGIELGQVRYPTEKTLRALAECLDGHTSYDELAHAAGPRYPPVPEERLAELAKKGLSQTRAARELGVSQKRLSKVAANAGISFTPVWMRPRPVATEFGKVLQAARLAAGYSYSRLTALSGLNRHHVMDLELGRIRRPKEKTLRTLAECFAGLTSYEELVSAVRREAAPVRRGARPGGRGRRQARQS